MDHARKLRKCKETVESESNVRGYNRQDDENQFPKRPLGGGRTPFMADNKF